MISLNVKLLHEINLSANRCLCVCDLISSNVLIATSKWRPYSVVFVLFYFLATQCESLDNPHEFSQIGNSELTLSIIAHNPMRTVNGSPKQRVPIDPQNADFSLEKLKRNCKLTSVSDSTI